MIEMSRINDLSKCSQEWLRFWYRYSNQSDIFLIKHLSLTVLFLGQSIVIRITMKMEEVNCCMVMGVLICMNIEHTLLLKEYINSKRTIIF